MNVFFLQIASGDGPIEEYTLYDTNYEDNTITLINREDETLLTGVVAFDDYIGFTTRSYVNYTILAILPE